MADKRKVGPYFKKREKIKSLMRVMLKPKARWSLARRVEFSEAWIEYIKAYREHEGLCKTLNREKPSL